MKMFIIIIAMESEFFFFFVKYFLDKINLFTDC